jgi:hypothetical protein
MTMRTHRLHGLVVRTNLPLAPAVECDDEPDVIVTYAEGRALDVHPPEPFTTRFVRHGRGGQLRYDTPTSGCLTFTFAEDGRDVHVFNSCPEQASRVASIWLGPGIAVALHLRGHPLLHGAAVRVDSNAVAIVGTSGAGKSTTAAALVEAGASLLSDEVVALDDSDRPRIFPGHPSVAVHTDAVAALDRPGIIRASSQVADDKWALWASSLRGGYCSAPMPLGVVYVLGARAAGSTVEVRRLPPHLAALALVPHWYGAHLFRLGPARMLEASVRLAAQVNVCEVAIPSGVAALGSAVMELVADARDRFTSLMK